MQEGDAFRFSEGKTYLADAAKCANAGEFNNATLSSLCRISRENLRRCETSLAIIDLGIEL